MLSFLIQAQIDGTTLPPPPQKNKTEKEKKLINKAFFLFNTNEEEKAYKMAHQLLKTVTLNTSKFNTNILLAYYFNKKTAIDSSLYYTNQSLQHNKNISDSLKTKGHTLVYYLFAKNYRNKGLLEESKKWHLKGIEASQKFGEIGLYYTHTHGLALTYSDMGDYQNALNLFKECLTYRGDPEITYGSYINIGSIYSGLKDYKTSNQYLEKALILNKNIKNSTAITVIKQNMATNYQQQGNIKKALSLLNESIKIARENGYKRLALTGYLSIGDIYVHLKKYKNAQVMYSSGLHDAIALGFLNEQKAIYDRLKDISIAQNDYKNAFGFTTRSLSIKDSISKLQKEKEINELEIKYKTLQKEKEIRFLQVENSNRKLEVKNQEEAIKNLTLQQEVEKKEAENKILSFQNTSEKRVAEITLLKKDQELQEAKLIREKSTKNIILYSFLILLVPVIGLLITYYQKLQTQSQLNKKQDEVNEQKMSSLLKEQELKLIKASIEGQDKERKRIALELHDSIGGNLAAIKLQLNSTTVNEDTPSIKTINKQLDDTYEQVRNLSHNLIPKKFSENNFSDVLEEYFNNIAEASSLQMSFIAYPRTKIDDLNETLQLQTFKIIQELITNTIKHAKASTAELQLNLVENTLSILFEDDGVGFKTEDTTKGIGFKNIISRLNKISGTLHIDSRISRGTIINIEISTITPHT
ncbi:tetratricopeptide repeat-containing sensor histidine kinase [Aquimarina longa]|uniref:tetratricopeptide repeat-containing sensor histidine kinase n=1 Tax=Aquimarina longa TaxID=1080221 RepID=UPI00078570D3|nr:tetratricopeptide repeat-containing sensor histidine kinase [Aquimarina longa]